MEEGGAGRRVAIFKERALEVTFKESLSKSTGKILETKMEGTHLEVTVLGRPFCHSSLGARNEETRNSQNESLISKHMI